jgi:hypothetical protein
VTSMCWKCEDTGWYRSSMDGNIIFNCVCQFGVKKVRKYKLIKLLQRMVVLSEEVALL